MICPSCHLEMLIAQEATPHGKIELDQCPRCSGIWFDAQELAALLHLGDLDAFAASSPLSTEHGEHGEHGPSPLCCPRGHHQAMRSCGFHTQCRGQPPGAGPLRLHQCPACDGLWLDGEDLGQMLAAVTSRPAPGPAPTPGNALWLFMFLTGLPLEHYNPSERRPVVTGLLVLVCALLFLWQVRFPPLEFIAAHGLCPARLLQGQSPWLLLTYMFLHGSLLHLLFNLYFLWIFGDNVEDRLGHGRFLALYLTSGVVAGLLYCLLTPDQGLPVVGASGAISGVMAAYALLFPRARLISIVLFFRVRWHCGTYLLLWLAVQVAGAVRHSLDIAWWAHIGGFLCGGALAYVLRPPALPALKWR